MVGKLIVFSKSDIPATADEIWDLVGVNFEKTTEWAKSAHANCRQLNEQELSNLPPFEQPKVYSRRPRNSDIQWTDPRTIPQIVTNDPPVRGRVISLIPKSPNEPNEKEQQAKQEFIQIIIMYSTKHKQLAYMSTVPIYKIIESYKCYVSVQQQPQQDAEEERTNDGTTRSTVRMECIFYPVPGFCWLAELMGLSENIRCDPRGPAGELNDIKAYFEAKRKNEKEDSGRPV